MKYKNKINSMLISILALALIVQPFPAIISAMESETNSYDELITEFVEASLDDEVIIEDVETSLDDEVIVEDVETSLDDEAIVEDEDLGYMEIMPLNLGTPPTSTVNLINYTLLPRSTAPTHPNPSGFIPTVFADNLGTSPTTTIRYIAPTGWYVYRWAIEYRVASVQDTEITISERNSTEYFDSVPSNNNFSYTVEGVGDDLSNYFWAPPVSFFIYIRPIPPTLTGTVTCEMTGRPIPGVTVNLYDNEGNVIDTTVTDENGFFDFGEVPIGDLEVGFDHMTIPPGYTISEENRSITTSPGGMYEEHFVINPIPPTLTKGANRTTAVVGNEIIYTLTVNNPNDALLSDFVVVDNVYTNLVSLIRGSVQVGGEDVEYTFTAHPTNPNITQLSVVLPELVSGNTAITFTVVVLPAAEGLEIPNVASLYGPPVDGERPIVDTDNVNVDVGELPAGEADETEETVTPTAPGTSTPPTASGTSTPPTASGTSTPPTASGTSTPPATPGRLPQTGAVASGIALLGGIALISGMVITSRKKKK